MPVIRLLFAVPLLGLATLAACDRSAPSSAPSEATTDSAMAAASGVTHMAAGKGPRESRIIPLSPMAGDVELLYGEPETPGEPFVLRIRELPGAMVPPHTHPVDEHITVVQGTWYFALGSEYKPEALRELKAGAYAFAPAGASMFGFSPDGAIVQVHGVGPFRIHWLGGLHTLDDKDWRASFRIPRDTFVRVGTRTGKIVQGYASGNITQYEVEEPSGTHFMASEKDLVAK